MPQKASTAATINVIGNQCRISAMLKNERETMIKSTPTATAKIPNCLDINHLAKRPQVSCTHKQLKSSEDIYPEKGSNQPYAVASSRDRVRVYGSAGVIGLVLQGTKYILPTFLSIIRGPQTRANA